MTMTATRIPSIFIAHGAPQELIASLGAPKVVTTQGTLEDVFMALTGRHLRDE